MSNVDDIVFKVIKLIILIPLARYVLKDRESNINTYLLFMIFAQIYIEL